MDFAVISMPKSRFTTRILFDGTIDESLQISTIQSESIKKSKTPRKFHIAKNNSTIFDNSAAFIDESSITTSTPFPAFNNPSRRMSSTLKHLKVIKNPMEQSIMKNSQRRKSKNFESEKRKKKVFFVSPEIVEISSIDEKMKKSYLAEQGKPKGTPIRPQSRIRPRLLNFTESASKLDVKKSQNKKTESKIPKLKRLSSGKKTSPIQQQQEVVKVSENFLKGVKLNRRFELLMKNLMKSKSSGK